MGTRSIACARHTGSEPLTIWKRTIIVGQSTFQSVAKRKEGRVYIRSMGVEPNSRGVFHAPLYRQHSFVDTLFALLFFASAALHQPYIYLPARNSKQNGGKAALLTVCNLEITWTFSINILFDIYTT